MNIKARVDKLVKKYKTRNPFEIIKSMNVIIVFYPLEGVKGFYQHFQRNNIIYIDERLSEHEKLFVCAHELGHMILHKKANAIFMDSRTQLNTDKCENEADQFAMNLLISDRMIEEHLNFTTHQLSQIFGFERKLIELRMKDFK
ncbi:MAG: ImmA/IrrE family metallo-endopeptidase [Lachnospiraceae bacterium]|nr:ImmA/IrrE family metallo-endopeptidase [Lachnospiraceae bacterium]